MKYEIIEHEVLSVADIAAIIQFDSYTDALAAVKAINESDETNTPGSASVGHTGAFRVGRCVVFNAYSQACYGKFLKIVGSLESPAESGESAVDSLARALWDGMYDRSRKLDDDLKAATDYIRAMFPGAENIRYTYGLSYFDYDGGKYFIRPEYSLDEKGKVQYAKIIVREYDCKLEPVSVDRDTSDVKGTLEKFFKKAKSAGDSQDSTDSHAANLWESMADPDSDECADTNAVLVYLESVLPQADIRKTGWALIQLEYKGMEYSVSLHYFHGDEDDSYILFFNKQSGSADLRIYRDTENPDEQIRKLFESPDSPAEPSLTDRVAKLEAVVKTLNAEIRKIKKIIKK